MSNAPWAACGACHSNPCRCDAQDDRRLPDHVREHIRMYENEARDLRADKKVLEKSLEEARKEAREAKEKMGELEKLVEDYAAENRNLRDERDEWKAKAEQAHKNRVWANIEYEGSREAISQLTEKCREAEIKVDDLERENAALQDEVAFLRERIDEMESGVTLTELRRERDEWKAKAEQAETEHQNALQDGSICPDPDAHNTVDAAEKMGQGGPVEEAYLEYKLAFEAEQRRGRYTIALERERNQWKAKAEAQERQHEAWKLRAERKDIRIAALQDEVKHLREKLDNMEKQKAAILKRNLELVEGTPDITLRGVGYNYWIERGRWHRVEKPDYRKARGVLRRVEAGNG